MCGGFGPWAAMSSLLEACVERGKAILLEMVSPRVPVVYFEISVLFIYIPTLPFRVSQFSTVALQL